MALSVSIQHERIVGRLCETASVLVAVWHRRPTMDCVNRPPRVPNWLPLDHPTIYFLTLCVLPRRFVLSNDQAWSICLSTLLRLDQWTILSALVMPDHLHVLVSPLQDRDQSVSAFVKWFKRWFDEAYWDCRPSVSDGMKKSWQWQEGCFDRLLRSDESLAEKWEYIRQNPVRAGLVSDPDEWPYQYQFNTSEL
jgi:putative transposase